MVIIPGRRRDFCARGLHDARGGREAAATAAQHTVQGGNGLHNTNVQE